MDLLRTLLSLHHNHLEEANLHAQRGQLLQQAICQIAPSLLADWAPEPGDDAIRIDLATGRTQALRFRRYIGEAMVFEGGPRPTTVNPSLSAEDLSQPYLVLPISLWKKASHAA